MRTIPEIRAVFLDSGLTVQELLDRSDLPITRSVLHRKLTGDVPTTTDELEALVGALDGAILIRWAERKPARSAPTRGSKAKKRVA